jgi:hypothetical protein
MVAPGTKPGAGSEMPGLPKLQSGHYQRIIQINANVCCGNIVKLMTCLLLRPHIRGWRYCSAEVYI